MFIFLHKNNYVLIFMNELGINETNALMNFY